LPLLLLSQPLDQILNMPALLAVPHSFDVVSTLWQTLHTAKSQSSPNRYLSATIPSEIYNLMLASAKAHPIFVLPLPRPNGGVEYFFIQWTFYDDGLSTVIFTSLEEYKLKGTWARSFLTLTHWTDLSEPSGAVLMRGEITSTTPPKATIRGLPGAKEEKGVASGSEGGERYLLTLPDAQLLLLGLQRFYNLESGDKADRGERKEVLEGFSAGTWGEETFKKLNRLAVGSLSGIM
jgi:ATP synthase F1 complex assembly factor 1